MALPQIITPGDDIAIVEDLYEDGALVNLSTATIDATIQNGRGVAILARVSQSSGATGADWANGRVVCEFSATTSTSLSEGTAWLEIGVTRAGKRTTWPLIELEVQAGVPR